MAHKNKIEESFFKDFSGQLRSIAEIPVIKKLIDFFDLSGDSGEESPEEAAKKDELKLKIKQVEGETIPLNQSLEIQGSKKCIILGSSQAGVIGEFVMPMLESSGFKEFKFDPTPSKTMSFVYANAARVFSDEKVRNQYDVVIIFPGFKAGENIRSTIDIINIFSPGRCFVVIPPPVTEITNPFKASKLGLNKGAPVPSNFWFVLRKGNYSAEREEFCRALADAVKTAGATPIDPRDVVAGGAMQESGVAFPNSPDGIHPGEDVCRQISQRIVEQILDCQLPIPASEFLDSLKPADVSRLESMGGLATAPATLALAIAARDQKSGQQSGKRFDSPDLIAGGVVDEIVKKSRIKLNSSQIQMMSLIENIFQSEGFTPAAIAAALANSFAESRFNPDAEGDFENGRYKSIGLFQLNIEGAGKGMSVESRKDPTINTRRIIEVAKGSSSFMRLMSSTNDPQLLAASFCKYIESPSNVIVRMRERADIVRDFLGLPDVESPGVTSV